MAQTIPTEFKCPISMEIMRTPIVLECGHTFDDPHLREWLRSTPECPTCRRPVNEAKITINYSLKSMIDTFINGPDSRSSSSMSFYQPDQLQALVDDQVEQKHVTVDTLKQITGSYYEDDEYVQVSLSCPETQKRRAVSFCCVIDVSGSMGSIVGAGEGGKAFTRLDLVKHVMNVLIVSLTEYDTISLISYSTETKLIQDTLFMTDANKKILRQKIRGLETENQTYTGKAIELAYKTIEKAPEDCLKSIILLTDGQDTEGFSILERKFTLIKKDPQVQFNTFGFSNDIWSDLLEKLATIGGGLFGYIPDQSMIGTIFINFVANTFQLFAQNVQVKFDTENFELVNKTELQKIVLKYGNSRNFLLKRKSLNVAPKIRIGFDENELVEIQLVQKRSDNLNIQVARYKMIELVSDLTLELHELKAYEKFFKPTPGFLKELNQGRETDPNNEQIMLGIKHWKTWGAHYIRSFKFAHLHEQCLNFKSPSMKIYSNSDFDVKVDKLTDLFCTLPPPNPTGINYGHSMNQPKLNMRNIMDCDAGCILATCNVKLANNVTKAIFDIAKGDVLEDGSVVICNLKTKFGGEMCKIDDLVITPYHPIVHENQWQLPIDVVIKNQENARYSMIMQPKSWVCTLVLDRNHIINAEGVRCISLGHGFTEAVLKHQYYGTNKVVENLREMKGWECGEIRLNSYRLKRDAAGCVEGMVSPVYA